MHRLRLLFLVLLGLTSPAWANDWPQFRGPDRDGISKETGLLSKWPAGGPRVLWQTDKLGTGYSGPAIVGDRLFIMGGDGEKEFLYAFDVKNGQRLWSLEIGGFLTNAWGGGPRGTPTVADGLVYVIGGKGDLICASAEKGTKIWSKNLESDLGGKVPFWGYTESPLVDGDHVVCTPGGPKGTLSALERKTGKVVWRSTGWTDRAGYSSIVVGTPQGSRQYLQMAGEAPRNGSGAGHVAGVDPRTGKVMWKFPRKHRITIPNIVSSGNYVYITSSYNVGCTLLELTSPTAFREVYANLNMANHHGGVILLDGHVYGYTDSKRGSWICQNLKTGEIVWSSRAFPKGSLICADGRFYCYAETTGELALVEPNTKGWKEISRFKITQTSKLDRPPNRRNNNFWTHPVVANGRLYLRDQEMLFCYDVKNNAAP